MGKVDKIYITKNSKSDGMVISITDDNGRGETYASVWEAEQIVEALYDHLPGVTLAWVRTMLDEKIGKAQLV
jgi:hypothetical protein